jgi:hypothetical protein
MAQIYGTSGSLSNLLNIFNSNGVTIFRNMQDIVSMEKNYEELLSNVEKNTKNNISDELDILRKKIIETQNDYDIQCNKRRFILGQEKTDIELKINKSSSSSEGFFLRLIHDYKRNKLIKRKNVLDKDFECEIRKPLVHIERNINELDHQEKNIELNFDNILRGRAEASRRNLIIAKRLLNENHLVYAGAIGEQKVIDTIKKFPEGYVVINDFRHNFDRAIHNRNTDDWIKSIQADHLLIGPSGVSVIETKNWSNESIENLNLFSPIQQIQRTSYAIFILLNQFIRENSSVINNHHWGTRKIPVHNIVLMIHRKPIQEFQYVKVLTLDSLYHYVSNLQPIFNRVEIQGIFDILVRLNHASYQRNN